MSALVGSKRARMDRFAATATACVIWLVASTALAGEPRAVAVPAGEKLVVHEWGTFTSFAGSNGVKLEFRPLVDSDLPLFVLDRWTNDGNVDPRFALSKRRVRSRQRMETPVIYFYSDVERLRDDVERLAARLARLERNR